MFAKRGRINCGGFGTDLSKYAGRVFEKERLKVEEPRISPSAVYDFAFRVTAGICYSASWTDIPSPMPILSTFPQLSAEIHGSSCPNL